MLVLVVKYHVKPGKSDAVQEALTRMAPLVEAQEPGCVLYQVSRSTEADDVFCLYEVYVDEDALRAHRETPHYKEIIEGQVVPLLDRRERELYTRVAG